MGWRRAKKGAAFLAVFLLFFAAGKGVAGEASSPVAREVPAKIEEIRLQTLREDIAKQLERIRLVKEEIERAKEELKKAVDEEILQVAKIYENMPAEEAARKLEKLDDETALSIVSVMKARTAGRVLGAMSPEKAARLSKMMVARARKAEAAVGK